MKYSQYIMMTPWEKAETFFWELPVCRDAKGNVLKTVKKPAFIAKYRTDPSSAAEGQIVCVRKMTIDIKPLQPPT